MRLRTRDHDFELPTSMNSKKNKQTLFLVRFLIMCIFVFVLLVIVQFFLNFIL